MVEETEKQRKARTTPMEAFVNALPTLSEYELVELEGSCVVVAERVACEAAAAKRRLLLVREWRASRLQPEFLTGREGDVETSVD